MLWIFPNESLSKELLTKPFIFTVPHISFLAIEPLLLRGMNILGLTFLSLLHTKSTGLVGIGGLLVETSKSVFYGMTLVLDCGSFVSFHRTHDA